MDEINHGRSCGACHDGKTKGPHTKKAASSARDCSACHMPARDVVIGLKRMDAVAFSHVRHLGVNQKKKRLKPNGFSCSDCHPVPFEHGRIEGGSLGMDTPHVSGACAKCHTGQKRNDGMPVAFAANTRCLTCHTPPKTTPAMQP